MASATSTCTPRADEVHRSLRDAGFVETRSEAPAGHHHLTALLWPGLPLSIEVHSRLNWPAGLPPIEPGVLFEASVPGCHPGFEAPDPVDHTLILAVHAWQHGHWGPDIADVAAMSASVDRRELHRKASILELSRLWATTEHVVDALFYGGPRGLSLRTWARSLEQVHERTMAGTDLEALISGFWWMRPRQAAGTALALTRRRLLGRPDESARQRALAAAAWLRGAGKPPR